MLHFFDCTLHDPFAHSCVINRGYPIQELTEASYLESAYLVLYGNLPTRYVVCADVLSGNMVTYCASAGDNTHTSCA